MRNEDEGGEGGEEEQTRQKPYNFYSLYSHGGEGGADLHKSMPRNQYALNEQDATFSAQRVPIVLHRM